MSAPGPAGAASKWSGAARRSSPWIASSSKSSGRRASCSAPRRSSASSMWMSCPPKAYRPVRLRAVLRRVLPPAPSAAGVGEDLLRHQGGGLRRVLRHRRRGPLGRLQRRAEPARVLRDHRAGRAGRQLVRPEHEVPAGHVPLGGIRAGAAGGRGGRAGARDLLAALGAAAGRTPASPRPGFTPPSTTAPTTSTSITARTSTSACTSRARSRALTLGQIRAEVDGYGVPALVVADLGRERMAGELPNSAVARAGPARGSRPDREQPLQRGVTASRSG